MYRRLCCPGAVIQTRGVRALWRTTPVWLCSVSQGRGNFYHFFGLPKQPEVDEKSLQKLYHDFQRRVHPDQANVQAAEQAAGQQASHNDQLSGSSTEISTYVNAAYEVLRDPYKRCRYLARLHSAEESKGSPLTPAEEEAILVEDDAKALRERDGDAMPDEAFLMEMLAVNELIFGGDREDEGVRNQMKILSADLDDRCYGYYEEAKKLWAAGNMAQFKAQLMEWTYVNNALVNVKNRL